MAERRIGKAINAQAADDLGLVTSPDDIDWEDRCGSLEERAGFSPDGLIGMEANLRFAGPETMETRSSPGCRPAGWFQRPGATGPRR